MATWADTSISLEKPQILTIKILRNQIDIFEISKQRCEFFNKKPELISTQVS